MTQQPIVFKLTQISAGENDSTAVPIPKLITPLPQPKYRYICGHCETELFCQMEQTIHKGAIFLCPDCQKFSRFDG